MSTLGLRDPAFSIFRSRTSRRTRLNENSNHEQIERSLHHLARIHEESIEHQLLENSQLEGQARRIGSLLIPLIDKFAIATPALRAASCKRSTREWAESVVGTLWDISRQRDVGSIALRTVIPGTVTPFEHRLFERFQGSLHSQAKRERIPLQRSEGIFTTPIDDTLEPQDRIGPWAAGIAEEINGTQAVLVLTDRATFAGIEESMTAINDLSGHFAIDRIDGDATKLLTSVHAGRPTWSTITNGHLVRDC